MDKTEKIFQVVRHSLNCKHWNIFKTHRSIVTTRHYCKKSDEIDEFRENKSVEKAKQDYYPAKIRPPSDLSVKLWNENSAIRATKRKSKFYRSDKAVDYLAGFQSINNFPLNLRELYHYLVRRDVKTQMLEQKYLPDRHDILKPDLATAHFLLRRGGRIKFIGNKNWMGGKGKKITVPMTYVPGLYVEKIDAEGTNLYYEGLKNLCDLQYLNWLSFKGLKQANDWWLDWVSKEYYDKLTYLDISGCEHVTYRGLSCFYRFEKLKTLKVEGVSNSSEFKLACIMLLDIFPDLEILGIDLVPPDPIDPLDSDIKHIPGSQTSLTKES